MVTAGNAHRTSRAAVSNKMEYIFQKIELTAVEGKFKLDITVEPENFLNFKRELEARGFTVFTGGSTLFIEWWRIPEGQ